MTSLSYADSAGDRPEPDSVPGSTPRRALSPIRSTCWGPSRGFPTGDTGPRHENNAVAEETREGAVGISQDRWCIQKRIIVGHSLLVKPNRGGMTMKTAKTAVSTMPRYAPRMSFNRRKTECTASWTRVRIACSCDETLHDRFRQKPPSAMGIVGMLFVMYCWMTRLTFATRLFGMNTTSFGLSATSCV
jgi:hypothetical protein